MDPLEDRLPWEMPAYTAYGFDVSRSGLIWLVRGELHTTSSRKQRFDKGRLISVVLQSCEPTSSDSLFTVEEQSRLKSYLPCKITI